MAFTISWALEVIRYEDTAVIPPFSAERGRLYFAMLRDSPVGQCGRKTVGDQGFLSMGEVPLLTLAHAVQ